MRVWYTSFRVRAVIPAILAKQPGIFPRAYMSTCSVIGPLTFLNTYKILSDDPLHALMIDHASKTVQLKIKEVIHSQWEKPTLNHQLYHVNLKLSL